MAKFYFKIVAGDRVKYACVEADSQRSADASARVFSGEGLEPIEEKDIPVDMTFKPSEKAPAVWEGEN